MLVIDAMDIMFQDNVDGFCIVSSDSDFTRLVSRLRESGKRVIGMGNSCASKTFISACNEYKFIDKFIEDDNVKDSTEEHSAMTPLSDIINTIARIVQQSENKGEYARLSTTKSCILQQYPDFDERNYGYTIFRKLIEEKTEFKLRQESSTVYIISDNTKIKNNSNKIEKFIYSIIETNKQFGLGNLANEIHNHFPNFNHKALGYSTFKKYISSIQWLKINAKNPTCLYVTINKSSKIQPT